MIHFSLPKTKVNVSEIPVGIRRVDSLLEYIRKRVISTISRTGFQMRELSFPVRVQ